MSDFQKGAKVEWSTPQGKTTGTIRKKVTGTERVGNSGQKGTKVKAAHKGDSLTKHELMP